MSTRTLIVALAFALTLGASAHGASREKAGPVADPASFRLAVAPRAVTAGGEAEVTLQLVPAAGIKINKYPKIKLKVDAQDGLVEAAEGVIGNDNPPSPDAMEANYFKSIDPVKVTLRIASAATKGAHEVPAKLSYFYCVAASGYCAPAKVAVKIPITIR